MNNRFYIVRNNYEKIVPSKIPYWIFWPFISLLGYICTDVFFSQLSLPRYYWAQILLFVELGILPVIYIWLCHSFQNAMKNVSTVFWNKNELFEKWLENRTYRIFTYKHLGARLFIGVMVVSALATALVAGMPFRIPIANLYTMFGLFILAVVGSQGAYIIIASLVVLQEIARMTPKISFYLLPNPAITSFSRFYSSIAFATALTYPIFAFVVWQSPYPLSDMIIGWLYFAGFFPVAIFTLPFYQIHLLMRKIKETQIEDVNQQIQSAYKKIKTKLSPEHINSLSLLMDMQKKVQNLPEWPISFENIFAFIATLLPVIQIIFSIIPD